jgi:hypothetical protein
MLTSLPFPMYARHSIVVAMALGYFSDTKLGKGDIVRKSLLFVMLW